jgi:hypothetical protein
MGPYDAAERKEKTMAVNITELSPRLQEMKAKVEGLKARVLDMAEEELRLALLMVVDGCDVDYAIERSFHDPVRKEG